LKLRKTRKNIRRT